MSSADELIQKHLDGTLTEADQQELDQQLANSPAAAEAFARATRLDRGLDRHYHEEKAVGALQSQMAAHFRRRRLILAAVAATLLVIVTAAFFALRGSDPHGAAALRPDGTVMEVQSGDLLKGPLTLSFGSELTTLNLAPGTEFVLESIAPAKRGLLKKGRLAASVAKQSLPMVLRTPAAQITVLGTQFILSAELESTRLEVIEGKVRLSRGAESVDVAGREVVDARPETKLAKRTVYDDRFTALWRDLHDPAKGYFSADGIPYHAAETLIVDGPDQGHLTTSETFSYWLWLEAMQGRTTGDWSSFNAAWRKMEEVMIPSSVDQATQDLYDPRKPATYVPEADRISEYPVALDPSVAVGPDPLYAGLRATYGNSDLYVMHWLVDVDDFFGTGKRAFVNTYQRGPTEAVWKTVPHPSKETFASGGPRGFLDLFIRDSNPVKQWRYTAAPDADARVVQAAYWAARWAREQGKDPAALLPLKQAARLGDSLRYALHDKYFKTQHQLLAWSEAWGGSLDRSNGWAWRSGASHVHFGYQNPVAAWALANDPLLRPASPGAERDWSQSLARQVEFYGWLQSAEGAIAGGATASVNGRYEPIPAGTPTFHGLAYVEHPVFRDPPSNEWFGWQPWAMGRLAQYAKLANDPAARGVVDRWAAWARRVIKLQDGGYSIPAALKWSGRPGDGLHVTTVGETQDVGVAASLARALIAHGSPESLAIARELLDRMWTRYRDDRGVSCDEPRPDYARFHEKVELPPGWRGALASGGALREGATFLDLRPKFRSDPDFPRLEQALRRGAAPVFRYHRFWAQVEIALANAEYASALKK